jgi:hypothetical protein
VAIVMRLRYADAFLWTWNAFIGMGKHAPAGIESRYETLVPATLSQRLPLEISFQRADKRHALRQVFSRRRGTEQGVFSSAFKPSIAISAFFRGTSSVYARMLFWKV